MFFTREVGTLLLYIRESLSVLCNLRLNYILYIHIWGFVGQSCRSSLYYVHAALDFKINRMPVQVTLHDLWHVILNLKKKASIVQGQIWSSNWRGKQRRGSMFEWTIAEIFTFLNLCIKALVQNNHICLSIEYHLLHVYHCCYSFLKY